MRKVLEFNVALFTRGHKVAYPRVLSKFQRSSSQFQRRDMYSLSMYGFKFKTQEIKKIFKILFLSSDIEVIEKELNKHKANLV